MSIPAVKFNKQNQPEFVKELRKRVNNYFKENNISKHANFNMKFKTAFMLGLYFIPLILMLTGVFSSTLWVLVMWVLMGFGMSGIGLSIMHDANHGSYSQHKQVNDALGFLMNFIGGYHINWRMQHNVLHHSFTNVDGFDEDIDTPVMRFSPNQEYNSKFRFQAFYAPFFYAIMTIYWIFKDFWQVFRYHKMNLLKGQNMTFAQAIIEVTFNKAWYIGLTLVLPILLIDLPWWQVVLGFLMMHWICGLTLALIFQTAHVIEETDFFEPDEEGSVENSWAIHQMRTTANFANGSRLFSWFIGGLNYQIEHHLFPNICHVHYRKISKIVKETAHEFGLPYYHHKTFLQALVSHFSLLNALGTGSYDRKLATAKA